MNKIKFFIFLCLASLSTIIIRCVQIIFLTNPENGFFYDNYEGIGHLLTALIIVTTAVSALFGIYVKTDRLNPIPKNTFALGSVSLLLGFFQIVEMFSYKVTIESVPYVIMVLRTVSIFLTGVIFCYFGICLITKSRCNFKFMPISVIAWILRLITTFISFSGMSNISENLYDVLALSSTLIFLLYHSKILCGINDKKNQKALFCITAVSLVISATATVPRIILAPLKLEHFSHKQVDSPIVLFFMVIYIAAYTLNICYNNRETNQ